MSEHVTISEPDKPSIPVPDTSQLVTEDDEPVDSVWAEKCQRLLTSSLYASWAGPPAETGDERRPFLATANVGLFDTARQPAIVPDVMVSAGTSLEALSRENETRSYFIWEIGKPPELAIEIVSDRSGGELDEKRQRYGRIHVSYYVVWDPRRAYRGPELRAYRLAGDTLQEMITPDEQVRFDGLDLGVALWDGPFEGTQARWLRFIDGAGMLLLTGDEKADQEKQRADQEKQRAEQEQQRAEQERHRAEQERQRADRLLERLRELGVDPGEI